MDIFSRLKLIIPTLIKQFLYQTIAELMVNKKIVKRWILF